MSNYIWVPGPVDAVMHLASPASPKDYLEKPIQTLKVGSLGTHNTLGLAKAKGAQYFLASTSEVYGDPQVHPQPETYWGHVNPVGPRGVYDEAKRFAEAMTMAYHRFHGLDVRIVRIFNVYGPRMRPQDGRVVSNFIVQALLGQAAHGVRGRLADTELLLRRRRDPWLPRPARRSGRTGPINIGNDGEFTMLELAALVLELTGSKSEIVYEPLPVDDPMQRKPDLTLARKHLGWEPTIPLREGLELHDPRLPRTPPALSFGSEPKVPHRVNGAASRRHVSGRAPGKAGSLDERGGTRNVSCGSPHLLVDPASPVGQPKDATPSGVGD